MQEAFREEGIAFAHRNLTVYMPPGTREKLKERPDLPEGKVIGAGAAAAQAEEDAANGKGARP